MWCPKAKLCSDGFDRNKQQWLKFNCDKASNRLLGGDPDTTCRLEDSMTGHPEYDSTYSVDDNSKHQTHDHDYSDPTVDEDDLGQNEEQDHLKDNQASKKLFFFSYLLVIPSAFERLVHSDQCLVSSDRARSSAIHR